MNEAYAIWAIGYLFFMGLVVGYPIKNPRDKDFTGGLEIVLLVLGVISWPFILGFCWRELRD